MIPKKLINLAILTNLYEIKVHQISHERIDLKIKLLHNSISICFQNNLIRKSNRKEKSSFFYSTWAATTAQKSDKMRTRKEKQAELVEYNFFFDLTSQCYLQQTHVGLTVHLNFIYLPQLNIFFLASFLFISRGLKLPQLSSNNDKFFRNINFFLLFL